MPALLLAGLGIVLVPGIIASVIASALTGRVRVRTGTLVATATLLVALALAAEAIAPSLWVLITGTVLFGAGFGTLDTALNAHAARHFGARDINWMHASYGLGATIGPLLVTALLTAGQSWHGLCGHGGRAGRRPGLPAGHADHRDHADGRPAGGRLGGRQRRAPGHPGPAVGAAGTQVLGPFLLILSLAMAALFLSCRGRFLSRGGRAAPAVTPPA